MMNIPALFRCRSCGSAALSPVVSLGAMPLANALVTREEIERGTPIYPLDVVFCQACSLVQITETVPPEELFGEYLYFSSYSTTLLAHAATLATRLIAERRLDAGSLVVELASNDGYLLRNYAAAGIPVLGIEPARNIARVAVEEHGIPTISEFFSTALAAQMAARGERADLLHAHNVLAHVADLNGFVAGIATVLKPSGIAVLEMPYVRDMIEKCEFDTIYHEHLCYFSLTALTALFARHGLSIRHVERLAIHGGSLRIFAGPAAGGSREASVEALLADEASCGLRAATYYQDFGRRVVAVRDKLLAKLAEIKGQGKTVAAYGAAAKCTVLLNFCAVGPDQIAFVVDANPHKVGRYVPGVGLPIEPPAKLLESQPDYTLLLVWNIATEVLAQQTEYQRRGGRFMRVIPEPELL